MFKTRNEQIKNALNFHQRTFTELNLTDPFFTLKTPYIPRELNGEHIHLFESELNRGADIYIEFVDGQYNPSSIERTLYRWPFNPHWEEEYHSAKIRGALRIFIPCEELRVVSRHGQTREANVIKTSETIASKENIFASLGDTVKDMPIRDFVAVMLKVPCSNDPWLNEMIVKSKQ